ncbi:MAG: hypothetical protein ACTSX1_13300, partial [Candidatus Heimdallarchaeaceae archaeon]
YCKKDLLSQCDMSESPKNQKECKYYKRATHFDRCMFLIFDVHCSCVEAQNNVEFVSDLEIAEMEESKIE